MNLQNEGPSKGGGDLDSTSSPPLSGDTSYLRKRIMPNLCDNCTIGIGTSMQKTDGVWQQYQHQNKKVHRFSYKKQRFKFCTECFERMQKAGKEKYLLSKGLIE